MNATSIVRPLCSLLAAPLLLIALTAAIPGDSDGAEPVTSPVAAKAPTRKSTQDGKGKQKSALGKHTKKHDKKHHKHHKKHHKHHKHGKKGRTSANNQVASDEARVARDEATLSRDKNQLRRALR